MNFEACKCSRLCAKFHVGTRNLCPEFLNFWVKIHFATRTTSKICHESLNKTLSNNLFYDILYLLT